MKNKDDIIGFSDGTKNIVDDITKKMLEESLYNPDAKYVLMTNPEYLFLNSYDSYDFKNGETPIDSVCRFTITLLKHIFPCIKIELGQNHEIIVEDIVLDGFPALPPKHDNGYRHIEYVKEVMIDVLALYQNDPKKMPPVLYRWYFKS